MPTARSFVASVIGLISGVLHIVEALPFNKFEIPISVVRLCENTFGRFLSTDGASSAGGQHSRRPADHEMLNRGTGSVQDVPAPNESDVWTKCPVNDCTDMIFCR